MKWGDIMRITSTKRLPQNVIKRELKEKPKALLYYLYSKANKRLDDKYFNVCKCSYSELLDLELLKTKDNTKDNRKAIRKLLDSLKEATYVSYEVGKDNDLLIEVHIIEPPKTIKNGFTQLPYSIVNNKDIPCIVIPTYLAILYHDYEKGECNPSMNTLAKYSGCSIRTCHVRLKTLEKLKILDIQKSKGGNSKDTNIYYTSNRHIVGKEGDFYYRLINVKNTRFEFSKKNTMTKRNQVKDMFNSEKTAKKVANSKRREWIRDREWNDDIEDVW